MPPALVILQANLELKFEQLENLTQSLSRTERILEHELKNKTILQFLTREKQLFEFYFQKLILMRSIYYRFTDKIYESTQCLLEGLKFGSIYSVKLRLAFLMYLRDNFRKLGIESVQDSIEFQETVYMGYQSKHLFLIVDETNQFIYQFKYVQKFLKMLVEHVEKGDILSIYSFDENIKVRYTHNIPYNCKS